MRYKLLVISAVIFVLSGCFLGTLFNSDPNDSLSTTILSITNLLFLTFMLVAFRMIKKKQLDSKKEGYKEGIEDVVNEMDKIHGPKGVNEILESLTDKFKKKNKL